MPSDPAALPRSCEAARLPYLGAQVLAALGPSPTKLGERAVRRIKKGLPVPAEQDVLWADVTFGTRTHGVVLTGQGLFLKDGPSGEDDDDLDWSQDEGAGYHYLRWRNFDPGLLGVRAGTARIAGKRCVDNEKFLELARECTRLAHSAERADEQAKRALQEAGEVRVARGVTSAYRKTAAATFKACRQAWEAGARAEMLVSVEVPATQYDAVLQHTRTAIEDGKVAGCEDARLAGLLVRKGAFTYRQAMNVAKTGRVAGVAFDEHEEAVVCRAATGMSVAIMGWLSGRSAVRGLDEDQEVGLSGVAQVAAQAAGGVDAVKPKTSQENALDFATANVISSAGRSVGFAGARAITSALGAAAGPVGAIAGFALGNLCGEAAPQAFDMAKGLFVEPAEKVLGRMFDAVLANIVFEHAFTQAEQAVLGVFLRQVDPRAYQGLLASLRESDEQEQLIRDFLAPAIAAVRTR